MIFDKIKYVKAFLFVVIALPVLFGVMCCSPVTNMTRDGEYYLMSGKYQDAIDIYTRAIDLNQKDTNAYLGRATAYEIMGYPHKALDDFNSAAVLVPRDSGVYIDRGVVHEVLGNYDAALKDYTVAIALDGSNASAFSHRGDVYMDLGDSTQAFEDYRSAARLGHTESQNLLRSKGMTW